MSSYYTLSFKCKILPEYTSFIENKYFETLYNTYKDNYFYSSSFNYEEFDRINDELEKQIELLPKNYRDLIDIWSSLEIGVHFYEYTLKESEFTCQISKKYSLHKGDLKSDYLEFMKEIIVPISSEIIFCKIESDDYGQRKYEYSDSQLRNILFNLQDKVKEIEHTYNEDKTEIYETRVIYKRSIKKIQFLDLNREYGFWKS